MGSFHPIDVYVSIGKNSTSYGADADGFLLHPKLVNNLGYDFVHGGMTASGAVMHGGIVEKARSLIDDILWAMYSVFVHESIIKVCWRNALINSGIICVIETIG